jgi:predicted GNAT family acetyltransferase/phage gp37-like protein
MRAADFLIENIELRHEPTSTGGVEIHAYRDGQEVGWVRFQKLRTGQYKAAMVHVPERLRRQGVGTAMYSYARQELSLDIVPSDNQTEYGRAFWKKQQAQGQQLAERKKRRGKSRWAFSGPGGWYGYYYGHSGEGEAGGDGGGGESVRPGLTEIENMPANQFVGGKDMLDTRKRPAKRNLQPLPGSTDLLYAVDQDRHGERVVIVDPGVFTGTKPQVVAALYLAPVNYLPNTVQVTSITVDEDYRGRGLAKALYGIVLTKMRKNLLSGDAQTPGGKRNWMSLASIPGVEVKGMVRIDNDIFNTHKTHTPSLPVQKYYDQTMDQIMELGGQFFYDNKTNGSSYWLFDVVPGDGRLEPYVKNSLSKLYGFDAGNLLLATWNKGINESQPGVAKSNVIFLNDAAAVVGQEHGKKLKLSPDDAEKIKAIADQHGAWYEGNGMDQELTKGIIDDYQGSWDDDLLSPAIKGYPAAFLYVLFSNIKENDTVKGKIGSDPDSTIFDRILNTQPSTNYFPDRQFDAATLEKFLQSVSEGPHNFVQMSQAPATEQNVAKFFKLGERLMWPSNWEEYPNRAGRVAKSVNDLRDKFLASRKRGVYVTGSDHLIAVRNFLNQQK